MLSLIEVKCPHCGAQGHIVVPPFCSILVGPCPECNSFVTVFCGHVLALDDTIMRGASSEEKRQHLLAVLMVFLSERVMSLDFDSPGETTSVLTGEERKEREAAQQELEMASYEVPVDLPPPEDDHAELVEAAPQRITSYDLDSFKRFDLPMLDDKDFFKAVFE